MVEVSASILSVKKENATKIFYNLETAKIDYFHIDVMDGKFVENNNLELMKDYALTISQISNIGLDVHLMVEDVENEIENYISLNPRIITFHYEAVKDKNQMIHLINLIKQNGIKVGIAISPDTDFDVIKDYCNLVHQVLIMTVIPGKSGQKLIDSTLNKISCLRNYIDVNNIDIDIEADGGINSENSKRVVDAGANILVSGSYIIDSENFADSVNILRKGE